LWPFEQLEIQTSVGSLVGYVSRPEQAPASRIVVALQTPPCSHGRRAPDTIGTSGVVWQTFKQDAVFLQFERPGGGAGVQAQGPHSLTVECDRAGRGPENEHWRRAILDSVRAVRDHERLPDAPTVYIGVGVGAAPALASAVRDSQARTVALVSSVLDANVGLAVKELSSNASRAPAILLLHAADDTRTPLAQAEDFYRRLRAARLPASLVIFEHASFDFGLASSESDCLDLLAAALGEEVRAASLAPRSSAASRMNCGAASGAGERQNDIQIENLQRL
jgi:hypothetical protein